MGARLMFLATLRKSLGLSLNAGIRICTASRFQASGGFWYDITESRKSDLLFIGRPESPRVRCQKGKKLRSLLDEDIFKVLYASGENRRRFTHQALEQFWHMRATAPDAAGRL